MRADLDAALRRVSHARVLLVASDYDGTVAPLVPDPGDAAPDAECVAALGALAALPSTHAALISGRGLADLARLSGPPPGVALIGSHGAEDGSTPAFGTPAGVLDALTAALDRIAAGAPGLAVERKPLAAALHFRRARDQDAARALRETLAGPARTPGVTVRHGSRVVELCLSPADKGTALARLRDRVGATAVVFAGDDLTDLDAFRVLGPADVGIEVGRATDAGWFRVADVAGVRAAMRRVLDLRREFPGA